MRTSSGPHRIAIGNPEASIIAMLSFRLCGQALLLPSGVADQSISRIRRAISPGGLAKARTVIGRGRGCLPNIGRSEHTRDCRGCPAPPIVVEVASSGLVSFTGVYGNEDLCSLRSALLRARGRRP